MSLTGFSKKREEFSAHGQASTSRVVNVVIKQETSHNNNTTMNDQNETTASPSEPQLCKMGCGFFVSDNDLNSLLLI